MILFKNVKPITDGKIQNKCDILVDNGKIIDISANISASKADTVYDLNGAILTAGYIDLHTHGGGGHDMMEGTALAIEEISKYHLSSIFGRFPGGSVPYVRFDSIALYCKSYISKEKDSYDTVIEK